VVVVGLIFFEKPIMRNLLNSCRKLLKEIRNFGIHVYWGEIIKVFLYHIDKIFISYFLDASNLAYYTLAFTLTFPISFFSNALSTTLYRKFSKANKIAPRLILINMGWVIISVIGFIILRKWIIFFLFSENYIRSLEVFSILAIAFGFNGFSKIYGYYLTAQGEGKVIRNISGFVLVIHLVLNLILIPKFGITGAAATSLVTYIFDLILSVIYYHKHIRNLPVKI